MPKLRCLLVDDERLARVELTALLTETDDCKIVAEASSVASALTAIQALRPDVVFLDVEMPGADGLSLFELLLDPPLVVIVSAYDAYAVRAFRVEAVDYLLKPVTADRLSIALERIRKLIFDPSNSESIYVEDKRGARFVQPEQIYLIQAYDHYVRLYHTDGSSLLRVSLRDLEKRLPREQFFRCNRSAIVRVDAVQNLERISRGRYSLKVGDEEVIMSEARAVKWRQRFGGA